MADVALVSRAEAQRADLLTTADVRCLDAAATFVGLPSPLELVAGGEAPVRACGGGGGGAACALGVVWAWMRVRERCAVCVKQHGRPTGPTCPPRPAPCLPARLPASHPPPLPPHPPPHPPTLPQEAAFSQRERSVRLALSERFRANTEATGVALDMKSSGAPLAL